MRPGKTTALRAALLAPAFLILAIPAATGRGDEPGRPGRLFRFGGSPPSALGAPRPPAETTRAGRPTAEVTSVADSTPPVISQPRLIPQPRVSRGVTDADPIVTRVSLGRADDGHQFGMFLQVYADGTTVDSEGAHAVGREAIKGVVSSLEQGDLYRIKGHCGSPSTDFVEQVQIVVYERSLGRLRANAFSFSGNPQGCDASVRRLQAALDALQTRLSRPGPGSPSPSAASPATPPAIQLNGAIATPVR